ncbi:MAG: hypothetical protein V4489_01415 [Chlamydiota bacterium]
MSYLASGSVVRSSPVEPYRPSFFVQEVSDDLLKRSLRDTAMEWKGVAEEASRRAGVQLERRRLCELSSIASMVSREIDWGLSSSLDPTRIFACYDEESNLQSIATVKNVKDDLHVECLVTHPNNISSSSAGVKGSGTALMHHLFRKALDENKKSITLLTLYQSESFYSRLGFEGTNARNMMITSEKIQSLLETRRCFSPKPAYPFAISPNTVTLV